MGKFNSENSPDHPLRWSPFIPGGSRLRIAIQNASEKSKGPALGELTDHVRLLQQFPPVFLLDRLYLSETS